MGSSIYLSDPHAAPDAGFVPGELRHLVVGNHARLLDARRTPVTITAVVPQTGGFELEIDAFEDVGARWELPLQDVGRFQFHRRGQIATREAVAELRRATSRFDRELVVECDLAAREATLSRIAAVRRAMREKLEKTQPGRIDPNRHICQREGHPDLFALLEQVMAAHEVADLEDRFSAGFVTNPRSGEFVKGHAIVLAELGLAPYRGQVIRNPDVFAEPSSRTRRAEHLVARLAFTQELWASSGRERVTLFRGMAAEGPIQLQPPPSFVSATFSREVATAHFEGAATTTAAMLWRQEVPISRLVMTFLETPEMNRRYNEAEAVLIADAAALTF
jgi:hypothetical protein